MRAQKRQRAEEEARELKRVRVEIYMRNFRAALPAAYQAYLGEPPPLHGGNREALEEAGALRLGESLHLWGDVGTAKTHVAVWTCARLIREHGVGVRYHNALTLERAAFDFDELPSFGGPDVILADDVDKVAPSPRTIATVARGLYWRPEHKETLITTANRSNDAVAERYADDEANLASLVSRMSYMRSVLVEGGDYRPVLAERRRGRGRE